MAGTIYPYCRLCRLRSCRRREPSASVLLFMREPHVPFLTQGQSSLSRNFWKFFFPTPSVSAASLRVAHASQNVDAGSDFWTPWVLGVQQPWDRTRRASFSPGLRSGGEPKDGGTNMTSVRDDAASCAGTSATRRVLSLIVAVVLLAAACSADESVVAVEENAASDATGSDSGSSDPATSSDAGSTDVAESTGSFIAYGAPEGMSASALAVSADGSQVAVGFSPPPGGLAPPATIVVYDVASQSEAWRGEIADAGAFGISELFFTQSGVGYFKLTTAAVELITLSPGAAPTAMPLEAGCTQLLNGAVDASSNALYSVIPSGFCRLDLSSGAAVTLSADAVVPGGVLSDSIRFDESSNLVVTVTDGDFATTSHIVDRATLAVSGSAAGEPADPADLYRDRLQSGVNLSSGSRVAANLDGSVVALLQPSDIEIIG